MNLEDYKKFELEIEHEYRFKLHQLRKKFVDENAKFKIGDFIYNVTGTIKVDRIGYEVFSNTPEIVYYGYRYKKDNGKLLRTKDKKESSLKYSLKLVSL